MPRVRVPLPDSFPFSTSLTVRVCDVNYGGHLGNDAVLSLLQEARVRYLREHGYSEKDVEGVGIIMTDAVVVYASQAFPGEALRIEVAADDVARVGCDFVYRITECSGGREVARAKTGIVFFDYATNKVSTIPDGFRRRFTPTPGGTPRGED